MPDLMLSATPETPAPHAEAGTEAPLPVVGRVMGLKDGATPFDWQVAVEPDASLQMGDVVRVETVLPDGTRIGISGIVSNVTAVQEGASLPSDVFLASEAILVVRNSRIAQIKTSRVEPEQWVPPLPGAAVTRVRGAARDEALAFDTMRQRLPAGRTRDGEPFYLDYEFLSGVKGGHANISGISGVATKTTYASFLLYAMFTSPTLAAVRGHARAIIFNVKGEDLLYLDQPNREITPEHRAAYARLGLPVGPFPSVALRAPVRKSCGDTDPPQVAVAGRTSKVTAYWWTVADIVQDGLLRFLFADADEGQGQISDLVARVEGQLGQTLEADPSHHGGLRTRAGRTPKGGPRLLVQTLDELVEYVATRVEGDDRAWTGGAAPATVGALTRRLRSAAYHLRGLVRDAVLPDGAHHLDPGAAQVTVVDIHQLHERAQRFVVGVVLSQVFREKEESGQAEPRTFVVLDELNKYAPRDGSSPIKELLLDIAERGRSMGVILLGAQQTASEVERRVASNAAIRIVGRLDMAEVQRPEYGFLDTMERRRSGLLKPGTMLVSQPMLPIPMEVTFPFPCWATRASEVARPEALVAPVPPAATAASPAGPLGPPVDPADPFASFDDGAADARPGLGFAAGDFAAFGGFDDAGRDLLFGGSDGGRAPAPGTEEA